MENIFEEIRIEREKQNKKWGEQNHPIVDYNYASPMNYRYNLPSEERVKNLCDFFAKENELTWGDIVLEEVVEALCAKNKENMREELIQCGAVIVAMIQSLDRNGR